MDRIIFVNLPVRDVVASRTFYTSLGFGVNERYSDEQVACVVVSGAILVMLIERGRFADFIADDGAPSSVQVRTGLSARSRSEVDDIVARAVAAGGTAHPAVQEGGMYGRSFTDPDGHVWELIHMAMPADPSHDPAIAARS